MTRLSPLLAVLLLMAIPTFAAEPNASPQSLLYELYRVHAQGEGPILNPTAQKQRQIFFTSSLAAALDRELNRVDPEETATLDFDPFYNAQETELGEIDIAVPKVSGSRVNAIVRFSNFGEPEEIVYQLVQDAHGWRIDDILFSEGNTLRRTLAGE